MRLMRKEGRGGRGDGRGGKERGVEKTKVEGRKGEQEIRSIRMQERDKEGSSGRSLELQHRRTSASSILNKGRRRSEGSDPTVLCGLESKPWTTRLLLSAYHDREESEENHPHTSSFNCSPVEE